MNVLDGYFSIFNEGSNDAKLRQQALDVFKRSQEALRNIRPDMVNIPEAGKSIASVNLGDVLGDSDLKDLDLRFIKGETDRLRGALKVKGKKASLDIQVSIQPGPSKSGTGDITPDQWKAVMVKNAHRVLERAREVFFHEFVHYQDWKRMGKKTKVLSKTPGMKTHGAQAYYSSPLEFNAFLQQGLSNIEHYLDGKGPADIKKTIGNSADEFYRRVLKVLMPGFAKNLTPKYQAKLKKRVAQMWNDIKSGTNGDK